MSPARPKVLPRRGSRQPRSVRYAGVVRSRSGDRRQPARSARHAALPEAPDRLQPQQLRRVRQFLPRRDALDLVHPAGRMTSRISRGQPASSRSNSSARDVPGDLGGGAISSISRLSRLDFGGSQFAWLASGAIALSWRRANGEASPCSKRKAPHGGHHSRRTIVRLRAQGTASAPGTVLTVQQIDALVEEAVTAAADSRDPRASSRGRSARPPGVGHRDHAIRRASPATRPRCARPLWSAAHPVGLPRPP